MELHPDRNKSSDAHEQFIELQEAYDYFINLKSGKVYSTSNSSYDQDWYIQRREQARQRAREYARMKYEEYLQSDEFKAVSAITNVFDFIGFILILLVLIAIPIVAFLRFKTFGLIISLSFLLVLLPYLLRFIRKASPDFSQLGTTFKFFAHSEIFRVGLLTILNLVLITTVVFRTFITPATMLLSFLIPVIIAYGIPTWLLKVKYNFRFFFVWFCLTPLMVNLFYVTNYSISKNPVSERYHFKNVLQETPGGKRATTTIELDGNKYKEYYFLRFFLNYNEVISNDHITYTIKDGAWGLRVMKKYEFD
jgi:hypothetical protein